MKKISTKKMSLDEPKSKGLKSSPAKMSKGPVDPKKTGRELTAKARVSQEKRTQFLKDEAKRQTKAGMKDFIKKSVAGAVGALVTGTAMANENRKKR